MKKLRYYVGSKLKTARIPDYHSIDELFDHLLEARFPDCSFLYPDGRWIDFAGMDWNTYQKQYRIRGKKPMRMRNLPDGFIYVLDRMRNSTDEGA